MATADEIRAAVLEDRWRTLTEGVEPADGSPTNSDAATRLLLALRELAAGMVHGIEDAGETRALPYAGEGDLLDRLGDELHDEIKRRILAFAEMIETARAA